MNERLKELLRSDIDYHDSQIMTTPHLSRIRHAEEALLRLLEEPYGARPAAPVWTSAVPAAEPAPAPVADEGAGPIYDLVGTIRSAIAKYDETNDHCRHDTPSDCVRCNAAAAVYYSDNPLYHPPGSHGRRQAEARKAERAARTGG